MLTRTGYVLVLLAIFSTAVGLVVTRATNMGTYIKSAQNPTPSIPLPREKVNRNLLPNRLRWALKELGNRLERSGNERRAIGAEFRRAAGSVQVQLIQEFPDRLRVTFQDGSSVRVVTFDGKEAAAVGLPPDLPERDLIESLVYDTPEHFFISQTRGMAIRALGNGFRSDDGLQYDIYELVDAIEVDRMRRVQNKRYYFNSDTQLLEKVSYTIERNGVPVQVETRLGDWQTSDQQKLPTRVTRLESDSPVWTLVVNSVVTSPILDDGIFSTR